MFLSMLFMQASEGFDISTIASYILPFAVVIVVFYFMLIRPENKRKKSVQKMLSELAPGDEITTRGGIVGKIISIKDDKVVIESGAERSKIQVMKWAILNKGSEASEPQS